MFLTQEVLIRALSAKNLILNLAYARHEGLVFRTKDYINCDVRHYNFWIKIICEVCIPFSKLGNDPVSSVDFDTNQHLTMVRFYIKHVNVPMEYDDGSLPQRLIPDIVRNQNGVPMSVKPLDAECNLCGIRCDNKKMVKECHRCCYKLTQKLLSENKCAVCDPVTDLHRLPNNQYQCDKCFWSQQGSICNRWITVYDLP